MHVSTDPQIFISMSLVLANPKNNLNVPRSSWWNKLCFHTKERYATVESNGIYCYRLKSTVMKKVQNRGYGGVCVFVFKCGNIYRFLPLGKLRWDGENLTPIWTLRVSFLLSLLLLLLLLFTIYMHYSSSAFRNVNILKENWPFWRPLDHWVWCFSYRRELGGSRELEPQTKHTASFWNNHFTGLLLFI